MVNKSNQVVCDLTNIILNDGVTIYPGYVEIRNGTIYRYDTKDPKNIEAIRKPWILHNRVEYKRVAVEEPCEDRRLQGKHFLSKKAMNEWLSQNTT